MVQLSHPYMTTGKIESLTIWTFVGKIISLLFNMLSRFVRVFLPTPRSKHLLISWLQSPSAVILQLKKIKSVTVQMVSPSICHEAMGPHSSALAWKIPGIGEPGGLRPMGSAKSRPWLSDFTFRFHTLEKEMATHSSVLACRIPGMGEPGGLTSMGSHRVGHDWSDLAEAADGARCHDLSFLNAEF